MPKTVEAWRIIHDADMARYGTTIWSVELTAAQFLEYLELSRRWVGVPIENANQATRWFLAVQAIVWLAEPDGPDPAR